MKKISVLTILAVCFSLFCFTSAWAVSIKMPVRAGESAAERDMRAMAIAKATGTSDTDIVVILVNAAGEPLKKVHQKPALQENNLTFTYNSPDHPWSSEDLVKVTYWTEKAYAKVKEKCGPPAFSNTVNVAFNPTLYSQGFAGIYYVSLNELAIADANRIDALTHEIVHAMRDEYVIWRYAYEEGMTRCIEVWVMGELGIDYQYLYHTDTESQKYTETNVSGMASRDLNFNLGFPALTRKYSQAGYAWWKVLYENPDFMRNFNQALFKQAATDQSILYDIPKLKALAASFAKKVEGKFFSDWYDKQFILNANPPQGLELLLINNEFSYFIFVFNRDSEGNENMLQNAFVSWTIYSCDGASLAGGEGVTSLYGIYDFPEIYSLFEQNGYKGKVKIVFDIQTPFGNIHKEQYTLSPELYQGLYGITDACDGQVSISGGGTTSTFDVINGYFEGLNAKDVAGTFTIVDKASRVKAVYTKDKGRYFGPVLK